MEEINAKTMSELYDADFALWLAETVELLKNQDFQHLDLPNLIEEVESLARELKRHITRYLWHLSEHLLKIKYWKSEREINWREWASQVNHTRMEIELILEDSPSLRNYLTEQFTSAYQEGRKLFLILSDLDPDLIPGEPDFTPAQALDEDWLPWQPH